MQNFDDSPMGVPMGKRSSGAAQVFNRTNSFAEKYAESDGIIYREPAVPPHGQQQNGEKEV